MEPFSSYRVALSSLDVRYEVGLIVAYICSAWLMSLGRMVFSEGILGEWGGGGGEKLGRGDPVQPGCNI